MHRYAIHEARITGQHGSGEAVQDSTIEASLFGEALGIALKANQDTIGNGLTQLNLSFVSGRISFGAALGIYLGGFGTSGSLATLAAAGDAYHSIKELALAADLTLLTVDPLKPILPQIDDAKVKAMVESRLGEIGSNFVSGASVFGVVDE